MYERLNENDYLMECLLYAGVPRLPEIWDDKTPFVRAIAKVRRFNFVENYAIVDGFGNCAKDFGDGQFEKAIDVYPYEFSEYISDNKNNPVVIERKSINTLTKAKMYLQQRGSWSSDLKSKSLSGLHEVINNLEKKI